jgi:hypothetical protein
MIASQANLAQDYVHVNVSIQWRFLQWVHFVSILLLAIPFISLLYLFWMDCDIIFHLRRFMIMLLQITCIILVANVILILIQLIINLLLLLLLLLFVDYYYCWLLSIFSKFKSNNLNTYSRKSLIRSKSSTGPDRRSSNRFSRICVEIVWFSIEWTAYVPS